MAAAALGCDARAEASERRWNSGARSQAVAATQRGREAASERGQDKLKLSTKQKMSVTDSCRSATRMEALPCCYEAKIQDVTHDSVEWCTNEFERSQPSNPRRSVIAASSIVHRLKRDSDP